MSAPPTTLASALGGSGIVDSHDAVIRKGNYALPVGQYPCRSIEQTRIRADAATVPPARLAVAVVGVFGWSRLSSCEHALPHRDLRRLLGALRARTPSPGEPCAPLPGYDLCHRYRGR